MSSVGQPLPHDSAKGHVTGKADYIDDIPPRIDELYVGFVGSPQAAGRLLSIDVQEATGVPGVVAILTHRDIPGHNRFGTIFRDEPFLADEAVLYLGQPVVVIAAESKAALREAQHAVCVNVEATEPILTLEDAIAAQRFLGPARRIQRGDVQAARASAAHTLCGVFRSGGQEQFYLESQAALAYPGEDDQMVVHSSTQNTTEIQAVVAEVLGLSMHQVVCICKRMGGAFGGKESQAAIPAMMAALVAQRTGRAARLVYAKDEDMRVTGKRHPYRTEWTVSFDAEGVIQAYTAQFYSDGGATADLSTAVMERSLLHADNAYFLPHVDLGGQVCFTNFPPNTAFRGFGGPQAMAAMENVIESIALHLGLDAYEVRLRNLYAAVPRHKTPYGQIFARNHLQDILTTLAASSQYQRRRAEINAAANQSPLFLRGLALTPVKFGISFTTRFLNQGNALVNVYADGTVQVSTGGTEMGQGLNTKIRQLVADEFGLSPDQVLVMPTSTEKNNNTSPTAASAGTDLNGAAAVNACRQIKRRLLGFAAVQLASDEDGRAASEQHLVFAEGTVYDVREPARRLTFAELAGAARRARVDLGARGFYATPGVDFNRETGRGHPFLYFTQGAAASEVEIDRFTGETRVVRVDALIDIGESINPGVDMGQITGGFVQGMGWVTAESLSYGPDGALLSCSPTTYKIPAITDVPGVFDCRLFESHDHVQTVRRSKAVGEPPLMLAISVWAAVKDALARWSPVAAAQLQLPATAEEILRCIELPSVKACPRGAPTATTPRRPNLSPTPRP